MIVQCFKTFYDSIKNLTIRFLHENFKMELILDQKVKKLHLSQTM